MNVNDLIAFNYEYNNKQQLVYRDEKYKSNGSWIGFKEDFTYDGANRLETISKAGVQTLSISYQSNMISNKSDAGTYDYASSANHRLTNVTPNYGSTEHDISYTRTGKVDKITETGSIIKELAINYGVDDQRFKTEYKENNVRKYTRYFFKDYEKEVSATGAIRHLNYIYAGGSLVGIYEQKSPANAMHYIYTDHLGSIRCITNSAGVVEQGLSYDAWGNRRNPGTGEKYISTPTDLMFYRGYTGHEHLDELGLINMNGRVYDPEIALFLSPDNYVQNATNSQNFNRYTYCLNNPLMYTDPDGEFWHLVIGAAIGGYNNWASHGAEFTMKGLGYFGIGAFAGAIGAGVGAGINSALAGGSFGTGFRGSSKVTRISTGFSSGFVTGAGGGGTSGFLTAFGNKAMEQGSNLEDMFIAGIDFGWKSALVGGAMGGIAGGIDAAKNNRNFWTGARKQYGTITITPHGEWSFEPYKNVIGKEKYYMTELEKVSSINQDGTQTIILPKTAGKFSIAGPNPNVVSFTNRSYTFLPSPDYPTQLFFGFRWHHSPITQLRHLFHWRSGSLTLFKL